MSFLLPGLHRPSSGREGVWESPTQTGDRSLACAGTTLRLRPMSPSPGEPGKGPRGDPEAGQLGMVPEGLWFVSSSPPPHSSMEKAVQHARGFFVR